MCRKNLMSKNCSKNFYIKFFLVKKIMSIRLVEKSLRRGKSCRIFFRSEQNWSKKYFLARKNLSRKKMVEKNGGKNFRVEKGLAEIFLVENQFCVGNIWSNLGVGPTLILSSHLLPCAPVVER